MNYERRYFDPQANGGTVIDQAGSVAFQPEGGLAEELYVFAPKVVLALNVARATRRPLLISGEPGCGKSSLAKSAAAVLRWRYYHRTVTSRTQAADLLWTFDALARLNDASKRDARLLPDRNYVEPGVLWWAFDPESATHRGKEKLDTEHHAVDRGGIGPPDAPAAVVLIDEIDKADPDVPNDLLEPFDRKTFSVRETQDEISARRDVLMMLTTNRERAMPRAFVRRCVTLELADPTREWLANIASRRYGQERHALHEEIAGEVMALRTGAKSAAIREPSTAEYLDAVIAANALSTDRTSPEWVDVKRALLWKSDLPFPSETLAGS
jgi:MoxR-like ATPase